MCSMRTLTACLSATAAAGTSTRTSSSNVTSPNRSVGERRSTRVSSACLDPSRRQPPMEPLRSSTTMSVLGVGSWSFCGLSGAVSSTRADSSSSPSIATRSTPICALIFMVPSPVPYAYAESSIMHTAELCKEHKSMVARKEPGAEAFGRRIKARREELGLSRRDLVAASGLSYPYVSQLETGYRLPSHSALAALAQALELSPSELSASIPYEEALASSDLGLPRKPRAARSPEG